MTRLNAKSSNRTLLMVGTAVAAILIALVVIFLGRSSGGSGGGKTFDLKGQPMLGQA